jgi:predicted transcriptional regulator
MSEIPSETIRLMPELDRRVTEIATALNRPKSWVIEQAVEDFVAVQEWHLAAIEEGIWDADAGRTVPHDDVAAWVRSWTNRMNCPLLYAASSLDGTRRETLPDRVLRQAMVASSGGFA